MVRLKFPQLCIVVQSNWCSYRLAFVRDKRSIINIEAFPHSPLVIITSSAKSDSWCSVAVLYAQTAIRGESLFLNRWEVMFWSLGWLSNTSPHHTKRKNRASAFPSRRAAFWCVLSKSAATANSSTSCAQQNTNGQVPGSGVNSAPAPCWVIAMAASNTTLIFNKSPPTPPPHPPTHPAPPRRRVRDPWSYWLNGFPRRPTIFWCIPCLRNDELPGTGLPHVRVVCRRGEVFSRLGNYCLEGLVPLFSTRDNLISSIGQSCRSLQCAARIPASQHHSLALDISFWGEKELQAVSLCSSSLPWSA